MRRTFPAVLLSTVLTWFTVLFGSPWAQAAGDSLPLQPLASQVKRLTDALDYIGAPLAPGDVSALDAATKEMSEARAVAAIQDVLDRLTLFEVHINAESRVRVRAGAARPDLVQNGWRTFLVKVRNDAGVTSALRAVSAQAQPLFARGPAARPGGRPWSVGQRAVRRIHPIDLADRWLDLSLFDKPPLAPTLSGLPVEYRIIQLYSRDAGPREAVISFDVGQGTQDIGFRSDVPVLFRCAPARPVQFRVLDDDGRPTTASFVIRDRQRRVYPSPTKRLAPDFAFQSQVYRTNGESVALPAGTYDVEFTRGPEYVPQHQVLIVSAESSGTASHPEAVIGPGVDKQTTSTFRLKRWINLPRLGWYSGDHHVHSSGCAHYEDPMEGVLPQHLIRHVIGEGLSVASALIWGPSYYFQKQFFTGRDNAASTAEHLLHYDVEISEFPSSHSGHLVLLNLRDQEYPGAKVLEEWPTWNLPILRWAKSQGATVGYAHAGSGLEVTSIAIPSLQRPRFDGVGANEYIVDVTHGLVDFISVMDTSPVAELSLWYHTLNAGFRTRIGGETDFPCIYGERIGVGRSYVQLADGLSYRGWVDGLRKGRSYVSDGKSHLLDFRVDEQQTGVGDSELRLQSPGTVEVAARVAARLSETPAAPVPRLLRVNEPGWDLERARTGLSQEVNLEIVVNGRAVASRTILADGTLRDVVADVAIEKSSWVALRILPSSHTNPVFVIVGGRPIRASRESIEWCLAGVDQCWKQKSPKISTQELSAAERAYAHARDIYRARMSEVEHE